jgi:hypothetical protein
VTSSKTTTTIQSLDDYRSSCVLNSRTLSRCTPPSFLSVSLPPLSPSLMPSPSPCARCPYPTPPLAVSAAPIAAFSISLHVLPPPAFRLMSLVVSATPIVALSISLHVPPPPAFRSIRTRSPRPPLPSSPPSLIHAYQLLSRENHAQL